MNVTIQPQIATGEVCIPSSKSVTQRVLAAALLRAGTTRLTNFGASNDERAALAIVAQLGAAVSYEPEVATVVVRSPGFPNEKMATTIHCGESGLSLRMFSMIAALSDQEICLEGTGSLTGRPVAPIVAICEQAGVQCTTDDGLLPLRIKGPLSLTDLSIDGQLTSQVLTGLLMAYGCFMPQVPVSIQVNGLRSRPYIDLTLSVMEQFGMNVPTHQQYETFTFRPGSLPKEGGTRTIDLEGDWSNAAFFLVAGAIAGSVKVTGLDMFSAQADKKVLEALQDCGCGLSITAEYVEVRQKSLTAFQFDARDCPDLFPPLTILAACSRGTSVIEGVSRLWHKESNRAEALSSELAKLGVDITIQEDYMIIKGKERYTGAQLDSHNDHRMAMAAAIMALRCDTAVTITHAEAVDKSYPAFYTHLDHLLQDKIRQE